MAVTDSFVAFVLEQLDPLDPIASTRMFGGVGLYAGDLFFALIAGDVLFTDRASRASSPCGGRPSHRRASRD
jgi:TfoX/Sxy family transcriptional regulator of competence genes